MPEKSKWYLRKYKAELSFSRMTVPHWLGERYYKQGDNSQFNDQLFIELEWESRRWPLRRFKEGFHFWTHNDGASLYLPFAIMSVTVDIRKADEKLTREEY